MAPSRFHENPSEPDAVAETLYMSAHYLRGLIEYVRAAGHSVEPVLAAMELSEAQMRSLDSHIPHHRQDRAFEAAAQITGDPHVGMHAGKVAHVSGLGVVGQLALSCATVRDLFELQVRYQGLIGNGVRSSIVRTSELVTVVFELARETPSRHTLAYTLAVQLAVARSLVGAAFVPMRVDLTHRAPPSPERVSAFFACEVRYECAQVRVEFPAELEALQLVGSEPGVREALETVARKRLETLRVRLQHDDSEVSRCQQYIADRLATGAPGIEHTAAALHTSVRTLQRRLEAHGMSYREVTEAARRAVADRLIADPTLSLLDVAFLAGFSDQTSFTRAFRRWFQATPGELRARRLGAEGTSG